MGEDHLSENFARSHEKLAMFATTAERACHHHQLPSVCNSVCR
uniref:Uncharacterized protein n=1 Tax=Arundo donax TaxID=35708 RepID=A0A0A8Z1T6_ARUDO